MCLQPPVPATPTPSLPPGLNAGGARTYRADPTARTGLGNGDVVAFRVQVRACVGGQQMHPQVAATLPASGLPQPASFERQTPLPLALTSS